MLFDRIAKALQKTDAVTDTLVYHLAERIIGEAISRGSRSITIKCHPTEKADIVDAFAVETEQDSSIKTRHLDGRGAYELGFFIGGIGIDVPFIIVPVTYYLPLLNLLTSEKTEFKGKQCFTIYKEPSSQKAVEKYVDVTLYLESDSSVSLDIEEIK